MHQHSCLTATDGKNVAKSANPDRPDRAGARRPARIAPLKAVTPEAAENLADQLYGMIPNARIPSLLAAMHRWTGFADLFNEPHRAFA
ncbi:MAG TPA: hypothetical protein VMF62_18030 [Acetobacteraceae bacterium]|nr:hypothetical protein [Acetobacteraceae bacterium]